LFQAVRQQPDAARRREQAKGGVGGQSMDRDQRGRSRWTEAEEMRAE